MTLAKFAVAGMTSPEQRDDEKYMRMALRLAFKAPVLPYPNPWVGCVIVNEGKVVGRGFHHGVGTNHAEVEALAKAAGRSKVGTLYTNLEPCDHYGRTPPCTRAIISAGIRRVVYAIRDPNPLVAGRGAETLRRHGIRVQAGLLAAEASALNEVYLKFRHTDLPFITAKVAASLDGKITTRTGDSKWITGAEARRRARALRSRHQAVVVGINTVLADNPHLGSRIRGFPDPWRVVLDSRLRIPPDAHVIRSGRCIVATTQAASSRKRESLRRAGAEVWVFRGQRVPLQSLLSKLCLRGVLSVMVEGGGEVLGSFFDHNLPDRVCWFLSPRIIGSTTARAAIAGRGVARLTEAKELRDVSLEQIGDCWLLQGKASRWALS